MFTSPPLEQDWRRTRAQPPAASALPAPVPTLHQRSVGSHLGGEIPGVQDLQDISRLGVIRNQLIVSLASNHSHLGRKGKRFTGYWVGNNVCEIQKELKSHLIRRAQMWVISTQTCVEERDTKVSYLQTREYWKSRKISLQRRITGKTTLLGNPLSIKTFSELLCQAKGYPERFPSCTFSRPRW